MNEQDKKPCDHLRKSWFFKTETSKRRVWGCIDCLKSERTIKAERAKAQEAK